MGFAVSFDHDVFISYAHENNKPKFRDELGWVDQFKLDLEDAIATLIGRPPNLSLWMDHRLHGNENFDNEIDLSFRRSAVLVFILSPSYAASPYCLKEWTGFHECGGAVTVGGKYRFFKVHSIPLGNDQADPSWELKLPGYQFFAPNPLDPRQFEPFRRTDDRDRDQRYWNRLRQLASDIADTLKGINGAAQPVVAPTGPAVYLAETTADMADIRDQVRTYVESLGIHVRPAQPLTPAADPLAAINAQLDKALISIHIVGQTAGEPIPPSGTTLLQLQFDQAQKRAPALPRIVWSRFDLGQCTDPAMVQFRASVEPPQNAPLVLSPSGVESLKTRIQSALFPQKPVAPVPARRASIPAPVYVACEPQDQATASAISAWLFQKQIDVVTSLASEDMRQFKSLLNSCHGLLLVYCEAQADRVRARAMAAVQAAARRKSHPLRVMRIYDGPPDGKEELNLHLHQMPVLNSRAGVSIEQLEEFLRVLQSEPGE